MATDSPVSAADQEFLALLVHRGWVPREAAREVLAAAGEGSLDRALQERLGWEPRKIELLRRTRAFQEPEIPGYEVEGSLGSGATAEVFAAKRRKDFQRVALKVLRPDLARDETAARRFLAEAKLLQSLELEGVVRGHRAFRFLGTYVLEMERVPGKTLEEHLEEGRTFDEREALAVVVQVARALDAMRRAGVMHRDLKPGNVMISRDGKVKLIDLGFAGAGMEGRADADSTFGTAAYLAPEQARGSEDLDARADIYSLGATLYHLVFGRLPFEAGSDQEMVRKQILDGLSGTALKGGAASPALHYFLEKMMAKDRDVRYATPAALIEDVEAHLAR